MARRAETPSEVLGRRLRAIRTERGWTQQQLADLSGVPQPTIARTEIGKRPDQITLTEAVSLAAALDVAPVHLMVPTDPEARVRLIPSDAKERTRRAVVDAETALAWMRGLEPLDQNNVETYRLAAPSRWVQDLTRQEGWEVQTVSRVGDLPEGWTVQRLVDAVADAVVEKLEQEGQS